MANKIHGRLGAQALAANTDTAIYTVPPGRKATVTLNVCNRSSTDTTFRVAMIDATSVASVANEDYLDYDAPLPGNGSVERDRITLTAGHMLMARAGAATASAVAWGVEEDA